MNNSNQNIVSSWFMWHFFEMPKFLFSVWKNYLWFGSHFFSIPILLSTLISPWRRYHWRYPKGFHPGEFLGNLVSNVFSRIVGAIIRIFLVILGVIVQVSIFIIGLMAILVWIMIPFLLVVLLLFIIAY